MTEGCGLEAGARNLTLGFFEDMLENESMMAANYEIFFWSLRNPGSAGLAAGVYRGYRELCVEALLRATSRKLRPETATALAQFLMNATDGVIIEYLSERDVAAARDHLESFTVLAIKQFG